MIENSEVIMEKERRHEKLKRRMQNINAVKFSVNIPRHIHTAFKSAVASERTDMKTVLMAYILKYIEKNK